MTLSVATRRAHVPGEKVGEKRMNIVVVAGLVIALLTAVPVFLQMRRHPKGLHILFFAEMWERFSFYGMRGLLIFYLTQHFLFDDQAANTQYGSYNALVYLLPLLGGFLADKYLGTRKAICVRRAPSGCGAFAHGGRRQAGGADPYGKWGRLPL